MVLIPRGQFFGGPERWIKIIEIFTIAHIHNLARDIGDFVLYRPPMKSTTLFLWFGPFIFLLAGAAFLVFYLKRRRKHIEEPALSEQQLKQAEALLKEGKG